VPAVCGDSAEEDVHKEAYNLASIMTEASKEIIPYLK